jgi:hypothetical protein
MATCTSGEPVSVLWTRNFEITLSFASPASAIRKSILLVYFLIVNFSRQDSTVAGNYFNTAPLRISSVPFNTAPSPSPLEFPQRDLK